MKKLISLLLALVLVVSMIPMVVSAAYTAADFSEVRDHGDGTYSGILIGKEGEEVPLTPQEFNDILKAWGIGVSKEVHAPNKHKYSTQYNTKYHWLGCACGCKISMEPHIDPKDAPNDYCTCGYHFSSNADLVTLWVNGCPPIENFNKNKTEYTLNAYTYKDVKEVKISTRTFDSEATVELPEDLTLKEGTNVIPVKVIAENQKNTKTYTLTIIKESE